MDRERAERKYIHIQTAFDMCRKLGVNIFSIFKIFSTFSSVCLYISLYT